jgi:ribosome-binding protein aMBF1 (putative translation factor)
MEIINIVVADKKHFKKFKLKNDIACKLEFLIEHKYCQVKYCDENFGFYNAQNLDLMILEFLEELADYNNGDSSNVKTKLENSVEEKVNTLYNRYPTTYKNSMLKYLLGLEDNIIKTTCIEQKLTYQQLADEIGLSESSLRSAASTNKVSKQVEKSIEMYLKIIHLEKELEKANTIKQVLKSWLN